MTTLLLDTHVVLWALLDPARLSPTTAAALVDPANATGFGWLAVTAEDALRVRALPWHHRDPFDRLLVAQALAGRRLVTHDATLSAYGVPLLVA